MDAQEIEHEGGHADEGIDLFPVRNATVAIDQFADRGFDGGGCHGLESETMRTIGKHIHDVVWGGLPGAAPNGRERIHVTVQLKDEPRGHPHVGRVRMHCGECITIACDLLFGTILGGGLLGRDSGDTVPGHNDAFDPIRRFDALDASEVSQRFKELWGLTLEELLTPLELAQQSDGADGRHRDAHVLEPTGCERTAHRDPPVREE